MRDAPLRGDVARRPNALERIATDAQSARDVSAATARRSNAASQRSIDERRGCGALKKKSCAFENLNSAASRDDTRHVGADATNTRAKRSATVRTGTQRVRARARAVTASILNFVAMAHRRIRAHHAARARRADLRASRSRASPRVFARSRSRAVERPRDARGRVATEPHTGRSTVGFPELGQREPAFHGRAMRSIVTVSRVTESISATTSRRSGVRHLNGASLSTRARGDASVARDAAPDTGRGRSLGKTLEGAIDASFDRRAREFVSRAVRKRDFCMCHVRASARCRAAGRPRRVPACARPRETTGPRESGRGRKPAD